MVAGERDRDRGPAAGGSQHGPHGVRGDRGREEVHIHEGVHQLSLLQRGQFPHEMSCFLLFFFFYIRIYK